MTKKTDGPSALAQAVAALENELLQFDRLADQALRHPLNSEKHIQSTASSLQQIGALEPRLEACMHDLMQALSELGARQQGRLLAAQQRAQELAQRHGEYVALMERMAALGKSAQALQEDLERASGETSGTEEVLRDVVERLARLVAQTEELEGGAREQDFTDILRHASSLRQQLQAAHAKMAKRLAQLSPSAASPIGEA
jgi:ABC-type transporter Mla subunit MlaD